MTRHRGQNVRLVALFSTLLSIPSVNGQPSTPPINGGLTASTFKGLDLDGWTAGLDLSKGTPDGSLVKVRDQLGVWLHRLPGYQRQWKIDQSFSLDYERHLFGSFGLMAEAELTQFKDEPAIHYPSGPTLRPLLPTVQAGEFSSGLETPVVTGEQMESSRLGAGGYWRSADGLSFDALVGPLDDTRGGAKRSGLRLDLNAGQTEDSLRWSAGGWLAHMADGTDHDFRANLAGGYGISDESFDRFQIDYLSGKRIEVSPVDGSFSHRQDDRLRLGNNLSVKPGGGLEIVWTSNLSQQGASRSRQIKDTRDSDFSWENEVTTELNSATRIASLKGGVQVEQQQYAGSLTQGRRNRLVLTLGHRWGGRDSLLFNLGSVKYRFDTPDESDQNDRDELRLTSELMGGWSLTRTFGVRLGCSADLNHIVYLYRARSAENRWTRLFELFVALPWQDSPISNNSRFTLSSHYTDYDFSPYDESQSRVFRSLTGADTLQVDFGHGWGVQLNLTGQLDDYGGLSWAKWVENVSEKGHSYTIAAMPEYVWGNFKTAAGWLIHDRRTSLLETSGTVAGERVRSEGPSVRFASTISPHGSVEFRGTSLLVHDNVRGSYRLPDVNLTVRWGF